MGCSWQWVRDGWWRGKAEHVPDSCEWTILRTLQRDLELQRRSVQRFLPIFIWQEAEWLTWGITGLFCSAVHLVIAIPTPSMRAKRPPPTTADTVAAFAPPRAASTPPVKAPDKIEFHGSSFCLIPLRPQSKVENRPPQTAKLPPNTGARAFMADTAPTKRSP